MGEKDQEQEKQPAHGFSAAQLAEINDEIQALLGERLPRRMPVEISWEFWATAMLARVGAILDSISVLVGAGRRADAEVALRTLFEQVTVFCWIAIDPDKHLQEWRDHSESRWAQFHEETREDYGIELISAEEAEALARKRMRTLELRTEAIDEYWPGQIEAFENQPAEGRSLKSFRGLYTALYRTTSRVAHAEIDALQPYIEIEGRGITVSPGERQQFGRAALALPLVGFFLLVHHHHFGWPAADTATAISSSLLYEPED